VSSQRGDSRLLPALLLAAVLLAAVAGARMSLRLGPLLAPTPTPTATATPTATPTPTATSTPTATPTPTATSTPTATPTPTATSTSTPTPLPATSVPVAATVAPGEVITACPEVVLPPAEGVPPSLLEGRRLVAFYGTPAGAGLGILGRYDITTTLALLNEQAQVYRDLDPAVETIAAFHMVVTVADAYPGEDGDYNHRVSTDTIRAWIDAANAAGVWSILDVQAGRADLMSELAWLEPFLWEPNVHLAVDPEFIVGAEEVPGAQLGRISGPQINQVQAWLDGIGRATGQRRILVIHQFDNRMITQKECLLDYPYVDLVWDADGFGGPTAKTGDYIQYSGEAGFEYGGFKLFYDYDEPLMTPAEVLELTPPPALVIYQ